MTLLLTLACTQPLADDAEACTGDTAHDADTDADTGDADTGDADTDDADDDGTADTGDGASDEPTMYDAEEGDWAFERTERDDECGVGLDRAIDMEMEIDDDEVVLFADDDGLEAEREGNRFVYEFEYEIDGDDYGFDCVFTFAGTWSGEFTSETTALLEYEAGWSDDGGRDCDDLTLSNGDDEEIPVPCDSTFEYEGAFDE
jgi:hypothetical protein